MSAENLKQRLQDLPTEDLLRLLTETAVAKARSLSAAEGLRFLFALEAGVYPVEGELSIAYDNGIHTKHRHIRYHDFFQNRLSAGERVLDVGCGKGELAYDLASISKAVVCGIDIDSGSIAFGKDRFPHERLTFIHGDILKQTKYDKYDTIVMSNVLEHLPDRPQLIRHITKECSPARFLIRVPLFEREWRVPLKKELGVEWRLDSTHLTEYTLESYALEIEAAGLREVYREVRWGEILSELVPEAVSK